MTVPVHNLYDFIHQTTKNKYFLIYFYPWGQRAIENAIFYQVDDKYLQSSRGISINDQHYKNTAEISYQHSWVVCTQPVILCHDQEPLNFSLYTEGTDYVSKRIQSWQEHLNFLSSDMLKDINLRLASPRSLQKTWTLLHSELNSPELKLYEDTGRFQGAYWWSHAVIARDWYRYAEHDAALKSGSSVKKIFLAYCRDTSGSRQYRQKFLDLTSHYKIAKHCQTSSVDNNEHGAESSAIYNAEDFNNTAISVVLETVFDNRIHMTEKILRPIACGHPFILAAGPGSLQLLRSYGFRTFAGHINEDYDDIQDGQERLDAIVKEMKRISELPKKHFDRLMQILRSIAAYNQQRFFSLEFHHQVVDELERNVSAAFSSHKGELDLDLWWQHRRRKKQSQKTKLRWAAFRQLIPLYRQQRLSQRVKREQ